VQCGRQFLIGALAPEVHEFHLTQRLNRLLRKSGKQIPRGLNFTPTSAKTALVGDPGSPARDDKNKKSLAARPSAGSGQALKVRTFKNEGLIVGG
jgi:hypothetical protein